MFTQNLCLAYLMSSVKASYSSGDKSKEHIVWNVIPVAQQDWRASFFVCVFVFYWHLSCRNTMFIQFTRYHFH